MSTVEGAIHTADLMEDAVTAVFPENSKFVLEVSNLINKNSLSLYQ